MEGENEASTVRFDVGGQVYRVARSLLDQYPTSMLACAAAERWQSDPEATIFIEGNGGRFQYCLDYMRRQQVHLPMTVSEAALLADLDYYGIQEVDPSAVTGSCLVDETNKLRELLRLVEERKKALQGRLDCIELASKCFSHFAEANGGDDMYYYFGNDYEARVRALNACLHHKSTLEERLSIYGLYLKEIDDSRYHVYFGLLSEKPPSEE